MLTSLKHFIVIKVADIVHGCLDSLTSSHLTGGQDAEDRVVVAVVASLDT